MTAWFVDMLLATGALMLFVLAVRKTVGRIFGPRIAYMLWLLPALRTVMPPLPADWAMLPSVLPIGNAGEGDGSYASLLVALVLLWVIGAASFFAWHSKAYARFTKSVQDGVEPVGLEQGIQINQSPFVQSPLAFGLLQKLVYLPADFAQRYSPREQHFAVQHEILHHKRGDVAANAAGLVLLSLHWFNPIAHIAYKAFRADQEAACDATVLAHASDQDRADYGQALFKSAIGPAPLIACRISASKGIKSRLEHIIHARETAHLHDTGSALASLAILAGLGLTATSMAPITQSIARPQLAFVASPASGSISVKPRSKVLAASAVVQQISADDLIVRARAIEPVKRQAEERPANAVKIANSAPVLLPVQAASGPVVNSLNAANSKAEEPQVEQAAKPQVALAGMQCPARGTIIATQQIVVSDDRQMALTMRFCMPEGLSAEDQRNVVLKGLTNTRTEVIADVRLPERTRAVLVSAIDNQIHNVKGEEI